MKKTALVFLTFCVICLSGCWNRVEIEDRAIVIAVGFDKTEGENTIEVTAQIVKPGEIKAPTGEGGGGGGGGGEAVVVYHDTGATVLGTLRSMARQVGKRLYFGETSVIVIGEDLARDGIGRVMDLVFRDTEPSLRPWIVVTKGRAGEVLETPLPTERVWGFGLARMIESARVHSEAPEADVRDFLMKVASPTVCPVAAGMEIVGMAKEPSKEKVSPGKRLVVGKTAVFRDYMMVGWLDEKATRGMLWVQGEIQGGIVTVPSSADLEKQVALEILRASGGIEPRIKDGEISIKVKVEEVGNVGEVPPGVLDLQDPEVIARLQAEQDEAIKNEVMTALAQARELNCDVFGFGEAVRRRYPREWPQYEGIWDDLFPDLDVEVDVDSSLKRTGLANRPVNPRACGQ